MDLRKSFLILITSYFEMHDCTLHINILLQILM